MSQKNVELVVGKLATDEDFRIAFREDPARTFRELIANGLDLTCAEIAALCATDCAALERAAEALDPRLQRASLKARRTRPNPDERSA